MAAKANTDLVADFFGESAAPGPEDASYQEFSARLEQESTAAFSDGVNTGFYINRMPFL